MDMKAFIDATVEGVSIFFVMVSGTVWGELWDSLETAHQEQTDDL